VSALLDHSRGDDDGLDLHWGWAAGPGTDEEITAAENRRARAYLVALVGAALPE